MQTNEPEQIHSILSLYKNQWLNDYKIFIFFQSIIADGKQKSIHTKKQQQKNNQTFLSVKI